MANDNPTSGIVQEQMLQALYISQVGIVIMSASFFGQEYFDSALRTTFLSNSRRINVFIAKISILAFVSILLWIISVSLGLAITLFYDIPLYYLGEIAITMLSWIMIGWISGFIAVILKSHIVSIAIIVPLLLAVNQLLVVITDIFRFLPDIATRNAFTVNPNAMLLEAHIGVAVQFIWVLVIGILAVWLNSRRDVK
jgi:hypothetical protein